MSKKNPTTAHGPQLTNNSDLIYIGEVPEVFLQENFNLSNIETFNEVITSIDHPIFDDEQFSTRSRHMRRPPRVLGREYLSQLQQTFTDYLDIIEDKLSSRISNRSGDFFQVMSSVHSVLDELSLAIKSVTNLRGKCSTLNESLVKPNLRKINLTVTRNNETLVLEKLEEISKLCRIQPQIQLLLSGSDHVGALDLIAKARVLLHKDYKSVSCLKHLEAELVESERMAGKMIQREFECRIKDCNFDKSLATEFNNLSKLVDNFSNGFSDICERNSLNLLDLLKSQTEIFVNKFHGERKRRIELCLDIEQWKMVEDIPEDLQRLINLLVDERRSVKDFINLEEQLLASEVKKTSKNTTPSQNGSSNSNTVQSAAISTSSNANPSNSLSDTINDDDNDSPQNKQNPYSTTTITPAMTPKPSKRIKNHIIAGGTSFVVVNSVIILLQTVIDYCKCCQDIIPLSKDLMGRLQDIMQLFNEKTFQTLFRASGGNSSSTGSGHTSANNHHSSSANSANKSGELMKFNRNVTARSLVLAQRSLKLLILVMPDLHDHFADLLPGDERLRRFDEIKFSYEDHAAKIPGRIITIVRDVIDAYLKEWEAKPPVPSAQFNEIIQYLRRLHENIQDILPPNELKKLFLQIHHTFEETLLDHLRRLQIRSDASPKQLLIRQELALFKASLKKMTVFSDWSANYENLWKQLEPRTDSNSNDLEQ